MSWAIWITGPPTSGKSAIARAVAAELQARGTPVKWLELAVVRESIAPAPRHTHAERGLVCRALGYMAALLVEAGRPVLIDASASRRVGPDLVRAAVPRFAEVQLVGPEAAVPEMDVPDAVAPAPELVIDTAADSLARAVERVVDLAGRLATRARAVGARVEGSEESGWAIWITGRPGSGKSTLAERVLEVFRERGLRVRLLDVVTVQHVVLGRPATSEQEQDLVHRVLAYAAKLLTEAGVAAIVDATAGRRAWREIARDLIPSFAEIQLLCPTEICLERERARRWGLTFETGGVAGATARPDIELAYEESVRPDLAVWTDVCDVQAATEQVLATIERLAGRSRPAAEAR